VFCSALEYERQQIANDIRILSNKDSTSVVFSPQEIRDAQVWSNLTWVDPTFRNDEQVKSLFARVKDFTETDKLSLIDWQIDHIKKILPTYWRLFKEGRIGLTFSPYYHPILPLLCDSDSAKEAMPHTNLPAERFQHPDDARRQIEMSQLLFEKLLGTKMKGMWPSEGSISEEAVQMCSDLGLKWIAADEHLLYASLQKENQDTGDNNPHLVYQHRSGLKLFFRDQELSDRIGFVYSSMEPKRAVEDFVRHLKSIKTLLNDKLEQSVVSVILDGENAWEYFAGDGVEFLDLFYKSLNDDGEIQTVTFSEATEMVEARELKSVFAGSWIDHNFKIWIGHEEDNKAWDYLKNARDFLVNLSEESEIIDSENLKAAWRQIYIVEGSDWFWWYGYEHRGPDNPMFDRLFRNHLKKVYTLLGVEPPQILDEPITSLENHLPLLMPDALVTPQIDGTISHFYEWFGAGRFDCATAPGAMQRTFKVATHIYFGFDYDNLYLRVDFANGQNLKTNNSYRLEIILDCPEELRIEIDCDKFPCSHSVEGEYSYVISDLLELAISRKFLWTAGFGRVAFRVLIFENDQRLEQWPENEMIEIDLPEKHRELFWHP